MRYALAGDSDTFKKPVLLRYTSPSLFSIETGPSKAGAALIAQNAQTFTLAKHCRRGWPPLASKNTML